MTKKKHYRKSTRKIFPIKLTIGNVYFSICVVIILYAVISALILTPILKHYGSQCKAVITDNESSLIHRYTTNCYLYEFSVGDETYTGNSLIEVGNKDKIGDTIGILYFQCWPSFNRPIYYYDNE
jgi:hypothetical protein